MLAIFWQIILIFSYKFQKAEGNVLSFAHVMDDGKLLTPKSLLQSIIESFKERGQVYCVVVIHDDIGINVQATFLSKSIEKCWH